MNNQLEICISDYTSLFFTMSVITAVSYYFSFFHSAINAFETKRRKLTSLVRLIQTQYTNILMVLWVCICIVGKSLYISVVQELNKTVVRLDKNTYEVSYTIGGILYKVHIRAKRGPKTLIQALDENDNDITDTMQAYLGPLENFHGNTFTPEFFAKKEITLSLSSGCDKTFGINDTLSLD